MAVTPITDASAALAFVYQRWILMLQHRVHEGFMANAVLAKEVCVTIPLKTVLEGTELTGDALVQSFAPALKTQRMGLRTEQKDGEDVLVMYIEPTVRAS